MTVVPAVGTLVKYNFKAKAVNGRSKAERPEERTRLVEIVWSECRKVARELKR